MAEQRHVTTLEYRSSTEEGGLPEVEMKITQRKMAFLDVLSEQSQLLAMAGEKLDAQKAKAAK